MLNNIGFEAYSEYENEDRKIPSIKNEVSNHFKGVKSDVVDRILYLFCFKEIYNGISVQNGNLFTTQKEVVMGNLLEKVLKVER